MTRPVRKAIEPNPEEASALKRMIGDSRFVVVNLGDRQALIEILDSQDDAQQLMDRLLAVPEELELTRESMRQARSGQGTSWDDIKKGISNG